LSNTLASMPRFTATVSPNFSGSSIGSLSTYANRVGPGAPRFRLPGYRRSKSAVVKSSMVSGFPSIVRPSNRTRLVLWSSTASINSRRVRFDSSNENSPVARTASESAWARLSSRIQLNVASSLVCLDGLCAYYLRAWREGWIDRSKVGSKAHRLL
jgi:hypothetical protein